MTLYIPSKDDLEKIVETTVSKTVKEVLPEAIRKATRKRWLTTDEVMEILQVSRRQVQNYRDENKLAFSQHGRTIRYDIDDVEDFLLNHKVKRIQ
ncbi:MAG: helix-turn-helix domain-containing protein [Balneolaceae bacterium]|nr:helix-turn-helix domain-containing protein [Balneolaceae bacterium]